MKIDEAASAEVEADVEDDDLFEMANLFPGTPGLPMTVWVSPHGNSRQDIRVKVNLTHGNQMNLSNTAVVGVRPSPHVVASRISPDDEKAVSQWIALNIAVLVAYWDGEIDTARLVKDLKPLPGAGTA